MLVAVYGENEMEVVAGDFNIIPGLGFAFGANRAAIFEMPRLVTKASAIASVSTAGVACTISQGFRFWFGARGTTPPGHA